VCILLGSSGGEVIYTHPDQAACCSGLKTEVPASTIEYATDTSPPWRASSSAHAVRYRASAGSSRTAAARCRSCSAASPWPEANMKDKSRLPNGVVHELRRFYYDTAQANHAGALAALLKLVRLSQVGARHRLSVPRPLEEIAGVTSYGFSAADVRAIERDNALRILRHA